MAEIVLVAETGRELGTRSSRRLRQQGKIPAVVYGKGVDPTPIAVEWSDLRAALTTEAGMNALIELEIDGEKHLSIVKDMQRDAVRRSVDHIDFITIERGVAIEVHVPIELVGEAEAVRAEGGVIDQHLYELLVLAKPADIPNNIQVDISGLEIGEAIRMSDLSLPPGVETETDPEETIVAAQHQIVEIEPEPEEGEELLEGEEGELLEGEEGEAAESAEGESGEGDSGDDSGE